MRPSQEDDAKSEVASECSTKRLVGQSDGANLHCVVDDIAQNCTAPVGNLKAWYTLSGLQTNTNSGQVT